MFNLRQIKEFNTIDLLEGESELIKSYNNDKGDISFNLFLNEGVVKNRFKVKDKEFIRFNYFKVDRENMTIYFENYLFANYEFKPFFTAVLDLKKTGELKKLCYTFKVCENAKVDKYFCEQVICYFFALFTYLTDLIDTKKINIIEQTITTANRFVLNAIYNSVKFKITFDEENIEYLLKKCNDNKCCYVKEHDRVLKDGRVIHIKPYIRELKRMEA